MSFRGFTILRSGQVVGLLATAFVLSCSSQESGPIPNAVVIPATDGNLSLGYDVQISGSGSRYVGAIDISHGAGSIVFDGFRMPVVAYTQDWFPAAQRTAYTILSALPNLWAIFFAYCDSSGRLTDIWYETTNGAPNTDERGSGTCVSSDGSASPHVKFPSVNMPFPSLVHGFTIDGAKIHYNGREPGKLQEGTSWQILPFTTVHCTTCGFPDTYELHSILFDPSTSQACFAILYLGTAAGHVFLNLALCLPSLTKLPFSDFPATYTTP